MKFLTLEKEIFGLDISDMSLKIIKLKKKYRSFAVASFGEIEIGPGIIERGVIQDEDALAKTIQALCKNIKGEKLNTKYVVASLPEERSFLQVIQMPKMKEEELKSAVIFEAENYIPLPINEVYLDFQTIPSTDANADHLDVLIVAIPKKIVNSYVSCLKKAGLMPFIFEVESQAIARALIKNETVDAPIALVDFGKTSTDFIVFSGQSIQFTCSIPVSSEQLTKAIALALEIDVKKAEKIKMGYDLTNTKKNNTSEKTSQAILPILNELTVQIKKYINFYQDHASHEHTSSHEKIQKILLCGGGAHLKGLAPFFSEKLNIPVETGNPWIHFESKKKDSLGQDFLSFVTVLGLALRGINSMEDN